MGISFDASPTITNCTFSLNRGDYSGGAVGMGGGTPVFTNCIFWGNTPNSFFINGGTLICNYCDVQGGYNGTSNLNVDPLFVDAANGDFRLQPNSPVLNKGNNSATNAALDLAGNPRKVLSVRPNSF